MGVGEWDGQRAEVFGDVAGDKLENAWGLGFAEKAGGEIVESALPADDDVGRHGGVEA